MRAAFVRFRGANEELDETEYVLLCKNLVNEDWKPIATDPVIGCKTKFDSVKVNDRITKAQFINLSKSYCAHCTPAQIEIAFSRHSTNGYALLDDWNDACTRFTNGWLPNDPNNPNTASGGPNGPAEPECKDTDNGAVDKEGDGCGAYRYSPHWCG